MRPASGDPLGGGAAACNLGEVVALVKQKRGRNAGRESAKGDQPLAKRNGRDVHNPGSPALRPDGPCWSAGVPADRLRAVRPGASWSRLVKKALPRRNPRAA